MSARFENGKYRDCKWCSGKGCINCKDEFDKEYKRQFPNGPQPIATVQLNNPGEMEKLKNAIGKDAMDKAFSSNGSGISEIIENLKKINKGRMK